VRNQAALALVALKTTLGVDLASPITPTEPLQYIAEPVSIETGVRTALEAHPEVRAAAKRSEAAQSEVRSAYGGICRTVRDLDVRLAMDAEPGEMRESPEGYSAGLVLTIPLFDGFMRENAIGTARAREEQANEQASWRANRSPKR